MKSVICLALAVLATGCATLDSGGEKVKVVSNVDSDCKNLGPVNVTITAWGLPSESQNVLRNNVAEVGGNTLFQNGGSSGIAYSCASSSKAN